MIFIVVKYDVKPESVEQFPEAVRKLDPRQYDPRTIVRDALLEADQEDSAEKRKREREEREAARAERKRRREEEAAAAGEDRPVVHAAQPTPVAVAPVNSDV